MRFSVLILTLFLFQCDPNVDIENIAPDKLLSVTCFISPQDTIYQAYVFRGSELGSTVHTDSAAVKDAIVTISDGLNYDTLTLTFREDSITRRKMFSYEGRKKNVTIEPEQSYFLDVVTSTGEHVWASCKIPTCTDEPALSGVRENDDFNFTAAWLNSSLHQYFTMIIAAEGSYGNLSGGITDLSATLSEDIKFPIDKQSKENHYTGKIHNAFLAEHSALIVRIRNIDLDSYRYFKSYQRYTKWQSNNSDNALPSFQGAPLLHSNIEGGVGVFGAFCEQVTKLEIH